MSKNLKKDELIEKVDELEKKLKSFTHLKEAVEAKDNEIAILNKEISKLASTTKESFTKEIRELKTQLKEKEDELRAVLKEKADAITNVKSNVENEKVSLEYEIQDLREKLKNVPDPKYVERLEKDNNLLVSFLNSYMSSFRAYLKAQQGSLDNIIELEALLSSDLRNKRSEITNK